MPDLKWRGCGDGSYVSHDGRFLIAQVVVPGKKGAKKAWALYGRVVLQAEGGPSAHPPHPWGWSEEPLTVGATKGECQRVAAVADYEPPVMGLHVATPEASHDKPMGYSVCQECGVRFDRGPDHKYDDYCGSNCCAIVYERLCEIVGKGVRIKDVNGTPLRVGPMRPNEPGFRPHRGGR